MNEDEIRKILRQYYEEDLHYESGRILGSMYTQIPKISLEIFTMFHEANLGNSALYPGTQKIEREVVKFLLKLTSGNENFYGHVLSGGTEANITALWAARNTGFRRILTTQEAHFSLRKAADLLKVPIKFVKSNGHRMSVVDLRREIKDGDIVVANAGNTQFGFVDPIEEIGGICTMHRCYLHVDAAFGGFVIPFLNEIYERKIKFGFEIPEVMSVTIDPHKMGLAPYPAGGLVARENIFKSIEVPAPYLTSGKSDTLLGTRQSGSVAAAYASILYFGWKGYRRLVRECMENTFYLVERAREMEFDVPYEPEMNIVNIKVKNPIAVRDELLKSGWSVSASEEFGTIRIVVMPHVKKEIIEEFLKTLKKLRD